MCNRCNRQSSCDFVGASKGRKRRWLHIRCSVTVIVLTRCGEPKMPMTVPSISASFFVESDPVAMGRMKELPTHVAKLINQPDSNYFSILKRALFGPRLKSKSLARKQTPSSMVNIRRVSVISLSSHFSKPGGINYGRSFVLGSFRQLAP